MNGDKLRNLREKNGILQKDLADKIGVATSTIGMYEQNRRQPDNDTLKRISQFFDVSVDFLLDNDVSNTIDNELKEIEVLKKVLRDAGYMQDDEDLSDEELKRLTDFVIANKDFLRNIK